jgi:hypothetical protein
MVRFSTLPSWNSVWIIQWIQWMTKSRCMLSFSSILE